MQNSRKYFISCILLLVILVAFQNLTIKNTIKIPDSLLTNKEILFSSDFIDKEITTELMDFNGYVFFVGFEKDIGFELWKTDGTTDGTHLVKDILIGRKSSMPKNFFIQNNKLFFQALNEKNEFEIWVTEGSEISTHRIDKESHILQMEIANHQHFEFQNYYVSSYQNQELGSELGISRFNSKPQLIKDLYPGPLGSYPKHFTNYKNMFFFSAHHPYWGREIWVSYGSSNTTRVIMDLYPGMESSDISKLFIVDKNLLVVENSKAHGFKITSLKINN